MKTGEERRVREKALGAALNRAVVLARPRPGKKSYVKNEQDPSPKYKSGTQTPKEGLLRTEKTAKGQSALAVDPTLTLISHVASIWCA